MKILAFVFSLLLYLNSQAQVDGHHHHTADDNNGIHFGCKEITADDAVAVDDLLEEVVTKENLETIDLGNDNKVEGIQAKMKGRVTEVCQVAGCWFRMEASDGTSIFLKMKEHKAVPLDIIGQEVVVEGVFYQDVTSVEMLRHFGEDAGFSQERIDAITEPKVEYKFFTEGVVLLEKATKD